MCLIKLLINNITCSIDNILTIYNIINTMLLEHVLNNKNKKLTNDCIV